MNNKTRATENNVVFIDTNLFLAQAQGIDVLGQLDEQYPHLQKTITDGVIRELEQLSREGSGAQKRAATLALQLIKRQHLNIVSQSVEHVDDALLLQAQHGGGVLATQDRELLERAREAGVPALTMKKKTLLRPAWE